MTFVHPTPITREHGGLANTSFSTAATVKGGSTLALFPSTNLSHHSRAKLSPEAASFALSDDRPQLGGFLVRYPYPKSTVAHVGPTLRPERAIKRTRCRHW